MEKEVRIMRGKGRDSAGNLVCVPKNGSRGKHCTAGCENCQAWRSCKAFMCEPLLFQHGNLQSYFNEPVLRQEF